MTRSQVLAALLIIALALVLGLAAHPLFFLLLVAIVLVLFL